MDNMMNIEENMNSEIISENDNNNTIEWSTVADSMIKGLVHNTDSVLDISKEVAAIKTLAPDDMYRQMILQVFQDEKMTTQEQIDQALRILRQRMDDQKDSAKIVEELQTKKTENASEISEGQSDLLVGVGGCLALGFMLLTPVGREITKRGFSCLTMAKFN